MPASQHRPWLPHPPPVTPSAIARSLAGVAVCTVLLSSCAGQSPPVTPSSTRAPASATPSPSPVPTSTTAATPKGRAPVRISIPAIDVASKVVSVGTSDRVLDIPKKPWVVGWWAAGVGAGSTRGTTVLAAHLTTRRYGDGPFVRAKDLRPGDAMRLSVAPGGSEVYTVESVETFVKAALPYQRLFDQGGPARVVLVTCGGTYRPETGHWDSNVVVTFVPRRPA